MRVEITLPDVFQLGASRHATLIQYTQYEILEKYEKI